MAGVIIVTPPGTELPPGQISGSSQVLPGVSYIYATPSFPQSWTATQTFLNGALSLQGRISGNVLINAADVALGNWTFPSATDTVVGVKTNDAFQNKTIDGNKNTLLNIFGSGAGAFLSVSGASAAIANQITTVAIQRTAPTATALTLPAVANQGGRPLIIADWSTSVTAHTITITPAGSDTIMQQASWQLFSTADQLGSLRLMPSTDIGGWIIA